MKFLPLLVANLRRRPLRTVFTALSIVVGFLLFGLLGAIQTAFEGGVELAGQDRLMTVHRLSIIQPLPVTYGPQIEELEGVEAVTFATFFGGVYQDPRNVFGQIAVDSESFFRLHPEFIVPPEQLERWKGNRIGAIVGRATADRFGWEVGDRIPLRGTIWRNDSEENVWEFVIEGIYRGAEAGTDETSFIFHHEYLQESRVFGHGLVGWYVVRVEDPQQAPEVARRIDDRFANSEAATRTATEGAFIQAYAAQVGDVGTITMAILSVVFFTVLLVAGNTMAQSVRERLRELAVLKSLGFTDRKVAGLVLAEALALAAVSGLVGLGLAVWIVSLGDPTGGSLPGFALPAGHLAAGIGLILALGTVTGMIPAVEAARLGIVDALRRR